jgi:hypothetical protein
LGNLYGNDVSENEMVNLVDSNDDETECKPSKHREITMALKGSIALAYAHPGKTGGQD